MTRASPSTIPTTPLLSSERPRPLPRSSVHLPKNWPSSCTSTSPSQIPSSSNAFNILSAILSTFELDEIPATKAAGYIYQQGMIEPISHPVRARVVQKGVTFWAHPASRDGPFTRGRDDDTHTAEFMLHGLLVTVERGALYDDVVDGISKGVLDEGMGHLHFAGTLRSWQ